MAYLRRERSVSPSKSQSPPRGRRSRSASPSKSLSPPRGRPSRSQSPPRGRRSRSRSLSKSRRSRSRSKEVEVAANRPNPANPGNNLYVTGLSMRVNNTDLEKCFSKEGKVVDCHLVTDPHTKESRGFAFITMDSVEDADRCIKHLHRSVLEGRLITVEKAKRKRGRTPTPGKYQGVVDKRGGGQRRSRSPSPRRWQGRDPNPRERRGRSRSPYAKRREDEYSSSYRRHRDDSYSARGGRDDPYASRGGRGYR